jgi:hypothetical protein
MSASNITSVARVLVSGFEMSSRPIPAHSPHGGENGPGVRIVSRPRLVRREAVVSLDTSRAPAMLLRCGSLIGADVRSELIQRIAVVP